MKQSKKTQLDDRLIAAESDYARYVNTAALFGCQQPIVSLINDDEVAFQVVHQVEELWMKLLAHTLIDIEARMPDPASLPECLSFFKRAHGLLELMRLQLSLLMSMSPAAYAEIRSKLGSGSGQESPGYRAMLKHARNLWPGFAAHYLDDDRLPLREIYRRPVSPAFALVEALTDLDIGLAGFRHAHLQLVDRMIGLTSRSLKGVPAKDLVNGVNRRLFPELWQVRAELGQRQVKLSVNDNHNFRI